MYQSHPRTAPNADAGDGCLFLSRPASLPAALVLPSCSYMSTFQRTLSLGQRKGPSLPKASAKVQPICNTSQIFQRLFSKFFLQKTQTRWKTAPYTKTTTAAFETAPCKTAAHKTEKERKRKERTTETFEKCCSVNQFCFLKQRGVLFSAPLCISYSLLQFYQFAVYYIYLSSLQL